MGSRGPSVTPTMIVRLDDNDRLCDKPAEIVGLDDDDRLCDNPAELVFQLDPDSKGDKASSLVLMTFSSADEADPLCDDTASCFLTNSEPEGHLL